MKSKFGTYPSSESVDVSQGYEPIFHIFVVLFLHLLSLKRLTMLDLFQYGTSDSHGVTIGPLSLMYLVGPPLAEQGVKYEVITRTVLC